MYIWFVNQLFVANIFTKPELIRLHTVKLFQVLLFNTHNSIQHYLFISVQLNGYRYCYVILTLAWDVFKVEFMIAYFKAVFYAESKNQTHFF